MLKPAQRVLEDRFISLLQSCKTLKQISQIQNQTITNGFEHNHYVAPKLVAACCAVTDAMEYARKVFDRIPEPNASIYNAMLKGYSRNEQHREVVLLFGTMMKGFDFIPNRFTFPLVIKSCGKTSALVEGLEVHCLLIKQGFGSNSYASTALIEMYGNSGAIGDAYKVFDEMPERNVVDWTFMVRAFIACGDLALAMSLFEAAPERDVVLWNTLISGHAEAGDVAGARALFDRTPTRDVMMWNTMLSCYAKNGLAEECRKMFDEMPGKRNVFSWNALIGGYSRNCRFDEVLSSFNRMLEEENRVTPNDATLVNVICACARLGALDRGKWAHFYAESIGFRCESNVFVGNALIDMYAKCGAIESSVEVFEKMGSRDSITWNSVICGLAVHGRGTHALSLFRRMKDVCQEPDNITFVGVLSSCAHLGLVEEGLSCFRSMVNEHGIEPHIEHYGCVVDLLARAGLFDQAVDFIEKMPTKADSVIWASLLGGCKIYKNVEIAELALKRLIDLEPRNPSNYVMLSNIYGSLRRWDDVARLKVVMRETGFKKLPACSLIEVNYNVVEFYSLDERHSETEEIYKALAGMTKLLRSYGHILELDLGD